MLIDDAIAIATVRRFVILGQRQKTIAGNTSRRRRLRREVPKHLRSIINPTVIVSVEY